MGVLCYKSRGVTCVVQTCVASIACLFVVPLSHASMSDMSDGTQSAIVQPENNDESKKLGHAKVISIEEEQSDPIGRPSSAAGVVKTAFSLAVVIAVMVCLAAAMKSVSRRSGGIASRLGAGGCAPSGLLEILGRYPVNRKQQLVVMRVHSRILLLSQSMPSRSIAGGFTTLAEITDPDEVASIVRVAINDDGHASKTRFEETLNEAYVCEQTSQYESTDLDIVNPSFGIPIADIAGKIEPSRTSNGDQAYSLRGMIETMSDAVTQSIRTRFGTQK